MEIAFHLGVHLTDEDHLVRCLMRNRQVLNAQGIAVPGPASYRSQLRDLSHEMRDEPSDAQTQEILLDGILDEDDVERVVFSSENFFAVHRWAVNHNWFYPAAGERVRWLCQLFPDAEIELFMAVQNPATFVPALIRDDRSGGKAQVLANSDPLELRWSKTITSILESVPGVPLTVWAHEDTPLLWPEILRRVSGHDPDTDLAGWMAWYWDLVTPKGHAAMRRFFEQNRPVDDQHRRRLLATMLERFAKPEALEGAPGLADWDETLVDVLSQMYEDDLDVIAMMPGVTLLEP